MKRLLSFWMAIFGMASLLLGVNMLARPYLAGMQFDLTEQSLYSIAPGTRTVLAGLKEPVTLRMFYSPELGQRIPQYAAYAERVRELLRQYAVIANGKVKLEVHNPEPFSDEEDRAVAYGLQGLPLDQTGQKVFFGLQGTNLLDDERAIPFFQPERERFLEYDLTRLVLDLANPNKPVVGLMTALPLEGDAALIMRRQGEGQPWAVMQGLQQSFAIRDIAPNATAIDADVKVLLLVHPQNLSDATLYAIDQFVMRGGRLLAVVAPLSETQGQLPGSPEDTSSDLKRLFAAWGIGFDPTQAVGDLDGAYKVRGHGDEPVSFPGYFNLRDGINRDDPATADLQEVVLANAGAIALAPNAPLSATALINASEHSGAIAASDLAHEPDPARILNGFKPDSQKRVIAARLRGELKSAFDAAPAGADAAAYLPHSDGPANLAVIADTDMLADRFWAHPADIAGGSATPFADNGALLQNLIGTLAGGDALIGLRSRGGVSRPFEVVDALRRDAEARYRESETALSRHLDETSKQLDDLRVGRDGSANAALNEQQLAAIANLKRDMLETRAKLRLVQFDLRHDIAALKLRLQILDIVAVPALLLLAAAVMALVRQARRRRRPA